MPHFTETFAIDIASMNGGGRITYGADCSPNEQLVEFARDTDLLIVEATLPRPERTGIRGHLTPAEAAEHASPREREAGAPDPCVRRARRAVGAPVCQRAFAGPVSVAREGAVYETGRRQAAPEATPQQPRATPRQAPAVSARAAAVTLTLQSAGGRSHR